jgi:hypothetical protein
MGTLVSWLPNPSEIYKFGITRSRSPGVEDRSFLLPLDPEIQELPFSVIFDICG